MERLVDKQEGGGAGRELNVATGIIGRPFDRLVVSLLYSFVGANLLTQKCFLVNPEVQSHTEMMKI